MYTIYMYPNMINYENILKCFRVIHQNKNRKLKSQNCKQRTSLNDDSGIMDQYVLDGCQNFRMFNTHRSTNKIILIAFFTTCG